MATLKICDLCCGAAKNGKLYGLDLEKPSSQAKAVDHVDTEVAYQYQSHLLAKMWGMETPAKDSNYEEYEICETCRARMSGLIHSVIKNYKKIDDQLGVFRLEAA